MDGRADYSSLLERERLYHSSLAAGLGLFGAPGADSSRAASLMRQQLSDLARTSTPLPPDPLAALHPHYLPPGLPLQAAGKLLYLCPFSFTIKFTWICGPSLAKWHGNDTSISPYGPLARYVKLRVVHAPGMPVTFSPPPTSKETAS